MKSTQRSLLKAVCGPVLGAALLSACYTYRPVELADLTPALEVRTRVSGAEADRLSEILGADTRVFSGTVEEVNADNLLLRVPVVSSIERGPRSGGGLNQRIEVRHSGVVEVEVKELDRQRTGIVAGAITAIVGVLVIRQLNQDQGGGDIEPPPPPPEDRGLRFPLRLRWGGP